MTTSRVLDWQQTHDLRNYAHPFSPPRRASVRRTRHLPHGTVMDQGHVGGCVGFGWSGALASMRGLTVRDRAAQTRGSHGFAVYELSTSRDEFQGDWPTADTGSSVLGGAKALADLGLIASYSWVVTAEDIARAVLAGFPVVIGVPWYESMFVAVDGWLRVDRASGLAGGHCLYVRGASLNEPSLTLRNSWGSGWGNGGEARLSFNDFATLTVDGFEACVPAR